MRPIGVRNDDAVSPVIGVILMVAITVILAAVIATFVIGLGDSLTDTAPQATFSFEYDADGTSYDADITSSGSSGTLTITHDGGDRIEAATLEIVAQPGSTALGSDLSWETELSAGSSAEVLVDADATVRIVYAAEDGSSSATLGRWEGPEA